jgi:hypothetical protein
MIKRWTSWACVVAVVLLVAGSVRAQEVLTNDSVIAMKKAGLSDAVILAKIRGTQSKFDLSTKSLVELKQAGLSDQIIEAMLGQAGSAGGTGAPPAVAAVDPRSKPALGLPQGRDSIFHVKGDQYVELTASAASLETNFAVFQSKSEIVLKGRRAAYRLPERQPVFFSAWGPSEAPMVRLKPGDSHDDRNLKFSSGSFMPFGGTHKLGVRSQDTIDVEAEKDPRGFYRIKPRKPMEPGEYGFIVSPGVAGAGGKIYDFGVD